MMTKKDAVNKLTKLQYEVTQCNDTEPPFDNEFWNHHEEGIYVDIVSGEPLFSSQQKYDSGTGWPSFYQPLEAENLVEKTDHSLRYPRTEIRSKKGDSHLGHVFPDGPKPTGRRYCMNSAALRFIPKARLAAEGYAQYEKLFENSEAIAYFAGGCFWCVEEDFKKIRGVIRTESGYMGGHSKNPSYKEVSTGRTGHAEVVKVVYNNKEISYDDLLKIFWVSIDPTVVDQQFADVGNQYRTVIFFENEHEEALAKASLAWLKNQFGITAKTAIVHATEFFPAENYHQCFAEKEPDHYYSYRKGSGRDTRLRELFKEKREKILRNFIK